MRYLTLDEVPELYRRVIEQSGGSQGIRDVAALESAIAQPRMTFAGEDLYPTIIEKASAMGFSLIKNHPFVDGNKRLGHAAMETFLVLHGLEIKSTIDEQERAVVEVAAGQMTREDFTEWLRSNVGEVERPPIPNGGLQ